MTRKRDQNVTETKKKRAPRSRKRPPRKSVQEAAENGHPREAGGSDGASPAQGVLEILPKGFGFLRTADNCYQSDPSDVFVPANLIRQHRLQTGCELSGEVSSTGGKRQFRKLFTVDGVEPSVYGNHVAFGRLVSIDPVQRLKIAQDNDLSMRVLDLIAPIGKGQRSLIVSPPRAGKTVLLQKLAQAIVKNHPEVHLMVVLVDERPEEVTEMRRTVDAEVIYSSNDESAQRHVKVVEIVLERARRLVEAGRDVVILLDSLTRVARAYNNETKGRGRTLSGGLDARTMMKPREFFGAARKVEHGSSLTIIATALVDTGSRMDDVIFEEFKGTGNMELILHRNLADRRIWPAIDIHKSGTRKEEKMRPPEEQAKINLLRRALADQSPENAISLLLSKLEKTNSNEQFLSMLNA